MRSDPCPVGAGRSKGRSSPLVAPPKVKTPCFAGRTQQPSLKSGGRAQEVQESLRETFGSLLELRASVGEHQRWAEKKVGGINTTPSLIFKKGGRCPSLQSEVALI